MPHYRGNVKQIMEIRASFFMGRGGLTYWQNCFILEKDLQGMIASKLRSAPFTTACLVAVQAQNIIRRHYPFHREITAIPPNIHQNNNASLCIVFVLLYLWTIHSICLTILSYNYNNSRREMLFLHENLFF